jgi:hypothetical protein
LDRDQLLTLGDHLALAGQHILLVPSQFIALVLERCKVENSGQIRLQQARLLAAQPQADCPQTGLATTQFLGDPVASLSPLQLVGDDLRMLHHFAEIIPNERIQLIGRNESGRAMLLSIGGHRRQFAATNVILVLRLGRAGVADATQLASATADQAAQ